MAYGVHRPSRNGVYLLQLAIFVVGVAVPLALFWAAFGEIGFIAAVVSLFAGVLLFLSVHIAQQWERIVVMRLGKFHAVKGPGVFFTIPFCRLLLIARRPANSLDGVLCGRDIDQRFGASRR